MRHDGFAGRSGQQVAAQPDDSARRNFEYDPLAVVNRSHVEQRPFAFGHQFDRLARILLRNVDRQFFDRFALFPVDLLDNHFRLTDLQFVSFAAHRFDQHRQVQHAAPVHDKTIGRSARHHAQRQVLFELAVETFLNVARRHVFSLLAEERRVVDRKQHAHRRFVDCDRFQRLRIFEIADRIADLEPFDADQRANLAAFDPLDFGFAQSVEYHQILDSGLNHRFTVAFGQRDRHPRLQRPARQLADGDPADVRRILQRRDQ